MKHLGKNNLKSLEMHIFSDDKVSIFSNLKYVNFLSNDSYIGILPSHAPMISYIKSGKVDYRDENNKMNSFFLEKDGILEIRENKISIFLI